MAKNSRAKGAAGERELSNLLKEHGYKTRRGQQYCGANGDADVVGLDGIHIECKRVERLNIDDAMAQAVEDAREGETPAVFHRKNRKGWLVTMRFEDWLTLYEARHIMRRCEGCKHDNETGARTTCPFCRRNYVDHYEEVEVENATN